MKWNRSEDLKDLLCEFVSWDSRTGTQGEIDFPNKMKEKLLELDYFQRNSSHIHLHDAGKERHAVMALYDSGVTKKTVVLMSHFDTVHTEEFGELGELAFQPQALTKALKEIKQELPVGAEEDLQSGDYLFGRGTMDMKMGIALHFHLLELASTNQWPINLLLLSVPDEEVNSAGMRAAVDGLNGMREEYDLNYELFLNSEPSFPQKPEDENYYIYSGSIGKIMPTALFYGRETHVGEPLSGITGHFMAAYLTKEMEFNSEFHEEVYGEKTPLPICLKTYDLKHDYSTQTPYHAAALYNVFLMERNAAEIMDVFKEVTSRSMSSCQEDYEAICERENANPLGTIDVLEYTELLAYADKNLGVERIERIKSNVTNNVALDEREMSIQICDQLMLHCQELAPATILFYSPPYYPAVNSTEDSVAKEKIQLTQSKLKREFNVEAKQVHYFNGISDLSYVNYSQHDKGWKSYQNNTPVWGDIYSIPFEGMQQLQAPILNIGPFGKDAHRLTERLHKKSAFIETPYALRKVIKSMFVS